MSWPIFNLGDLVTIKGGGTPSKKVEEYWNGDIPWASVKDLKGNEISSTADFITEAGVKNSATNLIPAGTILTATRMALGRFVVTSVDMAINQDLKALFINDSSVVERNYLIKFLSSKAKYIEGEGKGATVKGITLDFLKELQIPLPPLDEQKRIAAILDKADSVRRKRQQAIDLADDFLRSVFLDMFGDPVTNPKGWEVKKFGTVIDLLTDYHANGSYKTLNENVTLLDEPNYAYMVRTTDLEKKNYTDNVKYIDQHAYEHLSKTKVYGGELVINKIGSAGAVYLMPYLNRPVSLAMNQFMIRCNEHCLNEFAYYQLKTNAGARELEKRVQGAVTKTITKDAVRDIPIILPPIKLQRQFIDVVEKINKLKANTDNSSGLIGAKFNSISQKAFTGEL